MKRYSFILIVLFCVNGLFADNFIWTGGTSGWNDPWRWNNTTLGGTNHGYPDDPSDNATISVPGSLVLLDTSRSIGTLTVSDGTLALITYTLTLNSSPSLTGGSITAAGGSISAPGVAFTINGTTLQNIANTMNVTCGDFTLSSGTVNSAAGGVVNINCANMTFTGGTFNARASTINVAGDFNSTAASTCTINAGSSVIDVTGFFRIQGGGATFNCQTSTVRLSGTADQALQSWWYPFYNLIVNNSGGARVVQAGTIGNVENLTINAGSIYYTNGNNFYLSGPVNATIANMFNDGVFELNGTENFNLTNKDTNSGTVRYRGTGTIDTSRMGNTFYNLEIDTTGVVTAGSGITVNNNFTDNGSFTQTGRTMSVAGNFTIDSGATFVKGTTLTFNGTTSLADNRAVPADIGAVVVSGAGGVNLATDCVMTTLTTSATRTLTTDANTLTVTGNITNNGIITATAQTFTDYIYAGGNLQCGTFNAGGGTLVFNGAAQALTPNSQSFGNVQILSGSTVTMTGTATFEDFTIEAGGEFDMNGSGAPCTLQIGSAKIVSNSGIFRVADSTNSVTLRSASGNAIFSGTDIDYNLKTINLSGIIYQTGISLVSGERINLSNVSGSICTFRAIDIAAGATFADSGNTFNISGSWTNGGTAILTGTAVFNNTLARTITTGGTTAGVHRFGSLTHSGAGSLQLLTNDIYIDGNFLNSGSGDFIVNGRNMTVTGNVAVSSGTLNDTASAGTTLIAAGGGWNTTGGTYSGSASSIVRFTGTGTINTEPNFKNLIIRSAGTVTIGGNVTCTYFGHYQGTVLFGGMYTLYTTGNFVFIGSGYLADPSSVDPGCWDPFDIAGAIVDNPGAFSAVLDLAGTASTVRVGGNFFADGGTMTGSAVWKLNIPIDNNSTIFTRAYGSISSTNSDASNGGANPNSYVSVVEGTATITGCTNWDNGRPVISSVSIVSDDAVKIVFSKSILNTSDNIRTGLVNVYYNDSGATMNGWSVYTDAALSTPLSTTVNLTTPYTIYVQSTGATWNTDASGTSAGSGTSTDRSGTHQTVKMNISFVKGTFRSVSGNQIEKIDGTVTYPHPAVADECKPVLVSATLADTFTRTNGAATYKLNSAALKFSEPLLNTTFTDTADKISDGDGVISNGGAGGGMNSAGTITGWGSFATSGNVVTSSNPTTGGGTADANRVFANADDTVFTFLLGGNYGDGGCIKYAAGLAAPSGNFTPDADLSDLAGNLVDTSVTQAASGGWTFSAAPEFVSTTTEERAGYIDGRIDNYQIKFNVPVQIYDNDTGAAGFGANTVAATTFVHTYTFSANNISNAVISTAGSFNLNMTEIPMTYGHGDTGELPIITYHNTSAVKIISTDYRVEMAEGTNNSAAGIRIDGANPVVYAVEMGVDDPDDLTTAKFFDPSPYYNDLTGTYTDPGSTPQFDMHTETAKTTIPFTQRTYHNTVKFSFSEDVDNAGFSLPLDQRSGGYDFLSTQKSSNTDNNLGDSSLSGGNMIITGLGAIVGCDVDADSGTNFVQMEDVRTIYIHVAGWLDGSGRFPGAINSAASVPRSSGGGVFNTAGATLNANIKDSTGLALRSKSYGGSSNVALSFFVPSGGTIAKDWDIAKPVMRYIAATANYPGDPFSGTSSLANGLSSGNPLSSVEFVVNEALYDLPENTDVTTLFVLRTSDDNAVISGSYQYKTGVLKTGAYTNDLVASSDTDVNDQGFSVSFSSSKPDYIRVIWSYNPTAALYITDLRGNKMASVPTNTSLESVPPYISKSRMVANTNRIYVQFNENVVNATGGAISASDFVLTTPGGASVVSVADYDQSSTTSDKYILYLSREISDDEIVNSTLGAAVNSIKDNLDNFMLDTKVYKVSDIGIEFFTDISMEDFYRTGEKWRVEKFDGDELISNQYIKVTATIDIEKYSGLKPLLYYNVYSKKGDAKFWFPYNVNKAKMVVGRLISGKTWEFLLPGNDSELKKDKYISMVFKIGDYYCYRAPVEPYKNGFSPEKAETFMVKIDTIKEQDNDVTILNNVINPNHDEITKFVYKIKKSGPVSIVVYDLSGNVVKSLVMADAQAAGEHIVEWNGKNNNGKIVARGVYLIRIRAPGLFNQIRKVLVVK